MCDCFLSTTPTLSFHSNPSGKVQGFQFTWEEIYKWWLSAQQSATSLVNTLITQITNNESADVINTTTQQLSQELNTQATLISQESGYSNVRLFVQDSDYNSNFTGISSSSMISNSVFAVGASPAGQSELGNSQQMRVEATLAFYDGLSTFPAQRYSTTENVVTTYLAGGIGKNIANTGYKPIKMFILRLAISE